MPFRVDLVTVFHNETNHRQHLELFDAIREHEPDGGYRLIGVDNREINRGFAGGCNLGARHPGANAPVIGFVNPDVTVTGPFLDDIEEALDDGVVITGCRYGKPQRELDLWGVRDWVCGAALFVDRRFFTRVGGFDEQFVWGFEETDLIRQAEAQGLRCRSIPLPLSHSSPSIDTPADAAYKRHWFAMGGRRFYQKWPGVSPRMARQR